MKQDGLQYFTDTHLTVLGLIIFFSFFTFMLIQVFKSTDRHISYFKNIPFENANFKSKDNL